MKPKIPKYLVELDHELRWLDWPATPLWVARTRNPFCLGKIILTDEKFGMHFWPPIVDGDRRNLADKLAHALLREYDIYPGDLPQPEIFNEIVEPPKYLNMLRPNSTVEFVLEPHAPRLWRVQVDKNLETTGCTWVLGFGLEPKFPHDGRRVTKFLMEQG